MVGLRVRSAGRACACAAGNRLHFDERLKGTGTWRDVCTDLHSRRHTFAGGGEASSNGSSTFSIQARAPPTRKRRRVAPTASHRPRRTDRVAPTASRRPRRADRVSPVASHLPRRTDR